MSEISALNNRLAEGPVTVRDTGLRGMITLRGDLASKKLRTACTKLTGAAFPEQRRIEMAGDKGLAWMSPDEILILLPHAEVSDAMDALTKALNGQHHLAANVSDARAVIALSGAHVRETIARLCPVDMHPDRFGVGDFRRTRMAQVPAAFWMTDDQTLSVICFRSVADYAFGLLANAAKGDEIGVFA